MTLDLAFAGCLQLIQRLCPGSSQSIGFCAGLNPCVVYQQTCLAFSLVLKLHVHLGGRGETGVFKSHADVFVFSHAQKCTLVAVLVFKSSAVFNVGFGAAAKPLA